MMTTNRIAKVKDLLKFLAQFDPELDVVFENFEWGHEPVLLSDLEQKAAWLGNAAYRRTFQKVEYTSTTPCFFL